MKIFGSIGRIGSGKDEVIKYLSKECGLPMISVGDIVRQIATDEGLPPSRDNLHHISSQLFREHGKTYFMNLVLQRVMDKGWEKAGVTGIRTPDDVRHLKHRLDGDLVLFHVYVDDPRLRYERVTQRKSARDPEDYQSFIAQDTEEETMFHIDEASAMADYSLDNSGTREDLHREIDEIVSEECPALESSRSKGANHA
jgi:dephospho-CoA kinase